MDIRIPKDLEELVRQKVEDGLYATEGEVVADALRLMQARDAASEIRQARLRHALDRGYEDVADGRLVQLHGDDAIDAFFADL